MTSNLPPGVTNGMIEDFFADGPCEVCGQEVGNCECPECLVCQEAGNIACYTEDAQGNPICTNTVYNGHGMKLTWDQEIGREKLKLNQLKDQVFDQEMYIIWLEGEKERQEEFEKETEEMKSF